MSEFDPRRFAPCTETQAASPSAIRNGLKHVYVGNVFDPPREATLCPVCGARAIRRSRYSIAEYNLDAKGACKACGTKMAGVFAEKAGTWGPRRLPVAIEAYAA